MTTKNKYAAHAEMLHKNLPGSVLEFWIETAKALLIEAGAQVAALQADARHRLDLLEEVARTFTRDDDLPDELLPRIDAVIDDARTTHRGNAAPVAPAQPQGVNAELVAALEELMEWQVKNVNVWHNVAYDNAYAALVNAKATPVQEQKGGE